MIRRMPKQDKAGLDKLPVEILLIIFSYLDPLLLIRTVSLVCKRFTTILLEEDYWRLVYFRLLKPRHKFDEFPILNRYRLYDDLWKCEPDIHWRDMAVRLRLFQTRWPVDIPVESQILHSANDTVDSVHILKGADICITGSRERCIDLWDVRSQPYIKSSIVEAHRGWVTCLQSFEDDHFLSGGWDSKLTYWNVERNSCSPVWSFDCGRGVMAVACRPGLTVAATFSPTLILIDPRIRQTLRSSQFIVQEKALACISFCDHNSIITVARDKRLALFDLRMLAVSSVATLLPGSGKPRCLAVRANITFIGDTKGNVHLFDINSSSTVECFQQIPVATKNDQVASICPDVGGFIAGCSDRTVRIIIPTKPLYELKVLNVQHEVTSMSYQDKVLAIGKGNGAVEIYKP